MKHIILASNSPRRHELLAGLNLDFEVRVLPGIPENYPRSLPASEVAGFIAREKADARLTRLSLSATKYSASPRMPRMPAVCSVLSAAGHIR